MRQYGSVIVFALFLALGAAAARTATAQPQEASGENPALRAPSNYFALPIEVEHDFGADNGDATIIRAMPLYSFALNENWRLNFSARYIDIETKAKLDGTSLGTVKIDPWVYSFFVGYKF